MAGAIDYESKKSYLLRIRAEDQGRPVLKSTTFLKIDIVDVNDNAPVFDADQYNFIVGDFIRHGQFIGKVSCSDKDVSSKVRYEIPDSNLASVHPESGVLSLNRNPKRGSDKLFQVKCTDGKFSAAVNVVLKPAEVNEHSPVFFLENFEISVIENISPSFLTVITATDLDYGAFGTLTYSIDSTSLQKKFQINPTTGDIFTRIFLDREAERNGKIVLPIRASDKGGRFDTCKLSINIIDINDNDPEFEFQSYEATVSTATRTGSTILTVKAVDKDIGKNGDITYSTVGLE